jgi:predicted nucleic acid-binding protein
VTVFVDTSALFALCDPDDHGSASARRYADESFPARDHVTHRYVEVETISLVQARLGMAVVRTLVEDILPAIRVDAVDGDVHNAALADLLASGSRAVSLVDRVSFELMRRGRIETAFAFDTDFGRAGFDTVP